MAAGLVISSISGGVLGLVLARTADCGLAMCVLSYSVGGVVAAAALLLCQMYFAPGRGVAQKA